MKNIVATSVVFAAALALAGCPIYGNTSSGGGACGAFPACSDGYICVDTTNGNQCVATCGWQTCAPGQVCTTWPDGTEGCTNEDAGEDAGPTPVGDAGADGSVADANGHGPDATTHLDGSSSTDGSLGASDSSVGDAGPADATSPSDAATSDGATGDGGAPLVCTSALDGQRGPCAVGSICLQGNCYVACSLSGGADAANVCTQADEFNTCGNVTTSTGTYQACGPTTAGTQCNPDAGYGSSCTDGGICMNGTCE